MVLPAGEGAGHPPWPSRRGAGSIAEIQDSTPNLVRPPDACGDPVVEGLVIEVEINADAPGDDSENLNGEWVRFTSVADKPIDLENWEVAGESA